MRANTNAAIDRPSHVFAEHWEEWVIKSGVSPEITATAIRSFNGSEGGRKEIATVMNYRRWQKGGGWIVRGIDPYTGTERTKGVQFKPDCPQVQTDKDGNFKLDKNGNPKFQKYLSRKGDGTAPLYLPVASKPNFWLDVLKDDSISLIITEGAKKAGCLLSHSKACISIAGVDCGQKFDRLDEDVAKFALGRKIYLCFDADWQTNQNVVRALSNLSLLLRHSGAIIYVVSWDLALGKGVDDLIVGHGFEAFQQAFDQALTFKEWQAQREQTQPANKEKLKPDLQKFCRSHKPALIDINDKGKLSLKPTSAVAAVLFEEYRDRLAYNCEADEFYRYSSKFNGVWSAEPIKFIRNLIQAELDSRGASGLYNSTYISSVVELMSAYLVVREWNEARGLLPLQNGVLNLQTGKLEPHQPGYRFTWQLPYDFDRTATCQPIIDWLTEVQDNDKNRAQVLRAYLKAVVTGQSSLHRYLECLGAGGTGKSTFANLAVALVGLENTAITTLQQLEKNRFETSQLRHKRLLYITDSERYSGSVSIFKALTGGDPIRNEEKFKQAATPFVAQLMAIIATNEPIASTDYTSGLERRRLTIPFLKRIAPKNRRELLTITHAEMSGEFVPYLPGLLNWVLEMPDDQMKALLLETTLKVPSLAKWRAETLIETNPIAEWFDTCCITNLKAKTYIGIAEKICGTSGNPGSSNSYECYRNNQSWLYANYCQFCNRTGSNAVKMQRFSRLVMDLLTSQLNVKAWKGKDTRGAYIAGIAIRSSDDEESPRPISSHEELHNEVGELVTDYMTVQNRTYDDLDDYDGFSSNLLEGTKTKKPDAQPNFRNSPAPHDLINNSEKSAEPSESSSAQVSAVKAPIISNDSNRHIYPKQRFKVGDRVRYTASIPSRPTYAKVTAIGEENLIGLRFESDPGKERWGNSAYWLLAKEK